MSDRYANAAQVWILVFCVAFQPNFLHHSSQHKRNQNLSLLAGSGIGQCRRCKCRGSFKYGRRRFRGVLATGISSGIPSLRIQGFEDIVDNSGDAGDISIVRYFLVFSTAASALNLLRSTGTDEADNHFDAVIGALEDLIMEADFNALQSGFFRTVL